MAAGDTPFFCGIPTIGSQAQRLHYAAPGDGAMTMVASVVGCALIAAGVWGSISELWKKA